MQFALTATELGNGISGVEVVGEIDLYTAPDFAQALQRLIGRGARKIIVDLSATTFVDSTALGVLVAAARRLRPERGELTIVCPDPGLRKVFESTRLDRSFAIFDSYDDALAQARTSVVPPPG